MANQMKKLKILDSQTQLEKDLRRRFNEGFDLIQIILGPRQVGKTTSILNLLKDYLGPSYYVSAEKNLITQADWLNEVWQQAINKNPETLLVIDEIQKIENWSERIKTLWDSQRFTKKSNLKLILLGSSSIHIQTGLTESLTGRFEIISAYHWSLQDTLKISKMTLDQYLLFGGYPGSYKFLKNSRRFDDYIQNSIINTVIEKDLLPQGKVRNPALFRQTFQLLRGLPSIEISYTKLLGQLQEKGNTDLIKNYLDLYQGAFLFSQIHKYNPKPLKSRLSSPKIISMAPALIDPQQKKQHEFLGLCFESLIGAELIKSQLQVYYWREGDYEIDFVVPYKAQLLGIEVKTKKNKSSKSVTEFKKHFPHAQIIYIHQENFSSFSGIPGFLWEAERSMV
jgi:predicted AAA+ superfamily ATPase